MRLKKDEWVMVDSGGLPAQEVMLLEESFEREEWHLCMTRDGGFVKVFDDGKDAFISHLNRGIAC